MKALSILLLLVSLTTLSSCAYNHINGSVVNAKVTPNGCVSFSVGPGTGCAWMCDYCANQLGTYNYYFTSGVCTYQSTGCVGNPQVGVTYTCCSA